MDGAQLHVLTDPRIARGRSHREIAEAALAGGADVLQLRDKTLDGESLERIARELRALVRASGAILVVNDRLEVALAARADGLHVGERDLPIAQARRAWPPPGVLGASVRTAQRAREAASAGADYLGVGPVFPTSTKSNLPPPIGLEGLARVAAAVSVPVIGIGGINPSNAAEVIRAGAAGVAVISAVVGAKDVEAATRRIREVIEAA